MLKFGISSMLCGKYFSNDLDHLKHPAYIKRFGAPYWIQPSTQIDKGKLIERQRQLHNQTETSTDTQTHTQTHTDTHTHIYTQAETSPKSEISTKQNKDTCQDIKRQAHICHK